MRTSRPTPALRLATAARLLLGLTFFVLGLNFFFNFLPQPPLPDAAGALIGAFVASGYMMTLVKVVEVSVGVMLLSNRFVPLALVLLAPIMVNIVAFHAFLAPSGLGLPLFLLATHLYLAWAYRATYAPMLRVRVAPFSPAIAMPQRRDVAAGRRAA